MLRRLRCAALFTGALNERLFCAVIQAFMHSPGSGRILEIQP